MKQTPLEQWVRGITGGDLAGWQLKQLNRTLELAAARPWYRARLPRRVNALSELDKLPTMCAEDLRREGTGLCCVPQREIARMVTINTSGSTGAPKRVAFTGPDQRSTVDFFRCGLSTLVEPGDQMAILFSCVRPGGLGQLIGEALNELGALPVFWGPVTSLEEAGRMLATRRVETLVGPPVPILALARYCRSEGLPACVRAVLLSSDYVPSILMRRLEELWDCDVYVHYGMTEMGLGCAVDCEAHRGLHIRENDLLVEVVDDAGRQVADGAWGEIVFTTLTRRGMPLIRYRTGDRSRIFPGPCPCGSGLRRMAPPAGRIDGCVTLPCGTALRLPEWDEALFGLEGISDFSLTVQPDNRSVTLTVETQAAYSAPPLAELRRTVSELVAGRDGIVDIRLLTQDNTLSLHPQGKRIIRRYPEGRHHG